MGQCLSTGHQERSEKEEQGIPIQLSHSKNHISLSSHKVSTYKTFTIMEKLEESNKAEGSLESSQESRTTTIKQAISKVSESNEKQNGARDLIKKIEMSTKSNCTEEKSLNIDKKITIDFGESSSVSTKSSESVNGEEKDNVKPATVPKLTRCQELARKFEEAIKNAEDKSKNFEKVKRVSITNTEIKIINMSKDEKEELKTPPKETKPVTAVQTKTTKPNISKQNLNVTKNATNKEASPKINGVHFPSNKKSVTETTLDVQTKKVYKQGKWMEETTRTKTLTNEKGTSVESKRTTFRDLVASELPNNHAKERSLASPESPTELKPPTPLGTVVAAPKKTAKTVPTKRVQPPALKDNQESFGRQVLVSTNSYRKIHGAPPLKLSDKLNKLAKDWAEKLAKMERMEHGDKKNIGENIYCKTSSQPWFEMSGGEVVENWYNEVEDHNYNEEPSQGFLKTGHFTQLVWKDTKEMGVAFARNKNGHMAFVVAYFSPKGNWIGDFKSQVLPPGGVTKTSQNKTSNKGNTNTSKPTVTIISPDSPIGRKSVTSTPKRDTTKNKTGSQTSYNSRKTVDNTRSRVGSPTSSQSRTTPDSPTKKSRSTLGSITSYQSRNKVGSPTSSFNSKTKTPTSTQSRSSLTSSVSSTSKTSTSSGTPRSTTVTPSNKSRSSVDSPSIYNSRNSISTPTSVKSEGLISTAADSPSRKPFSSPSKSITKSAASVTSAISMVDQDFYDDFLKAHNFYRSKHGVEPLKLENELSQYAQEWADKIAKKDMMEHRSDSEFGENIYMKWSPNPNYKIPGEEAVESWYEEIDDYEFGKEPLDLSAGHFTQVIWADTEELGVGVAKSNSGKIYVVANYDPPGNYIGQFSKMVPPPI